jgi:hypothetical protein
MKCFHAGAPKPLVCASPHEGRRLIRFIVPIQIDLLFTMLFTNSKFFLDFHSVRRTSGEYCYVIIYSLPELTLCFLYALCSWQSVVNVMT